MPDSEIIPALAGNTVPNRAGRAIGSVLIDSGRLKLNDVTRVLNLQRDKKLRFGEAAVELGLLAPADIEFALARQFDYPYLTRGESAVSQELVAAYDPFCSQVEALRAVRSQLMLRWFNDPAHKSLAVVSAERGEGRSFIAANIAVVFAQLGGRTLLIDADLRHPVQHRLFGIENNTGLSAALSYRGGFEVTKRIASLHNLTVLPAGPIPPNPAELLARPPFAQLLRDLASHFDYIVIDTPAAAETADAQTISVRAGAAMIVARTNASRIAQVRKVADSLTVAKAAIVGTLLNDV